MAVCGPFRASPTGPAIKNKITNFNGKELSSRNTSDVSSAIYGGEKVGRVSQRGRRYLHVAHVSIRLLHGTLDVGHRNRSNREKSRGSRVPQTDDTAHFHSAFDATRSIDLSAFFFSSSLFRLLFSLTGFSLTGPICASLLCEFSLDGDVLHVNTKSCHHVSVSNYVAAVRGGACR